MRGAEVTIRESRDGDIRSRVTPAPFLDRAEIEEALPWFQGALAHLEGPDDDVSREGARRRLLLRGLHQIQLVLAS
jgi:hypothetical protein